MNRWLNRSVTLVLTALIGWGVWSVLHWLLLAADWRVVVSNLPLYAVGSYPVDQRWRPLLWMVALVVLIGLTLLGPRRGPLQRWLPLIWLAMAPLGLWLVAGSSTSPPATSQSPRGAMASQINGNQRCRGPRRDPSRVKPISTTRATIHSSGRQR